MATAAAAMLAYGVGMLPSSLGDRLSALPPAVLVVGAVLAGLVMLASIGTAQWLVLRRHGYGQPWWIVTTAAAWVVGLAVFFLVATPMWQPGQTTLVTVAVGIVAGALMAASVATVTGFAAVRLVATGYGNRDQADTARG